MDILLTDRNRKLNIEISGRYYLYMEDKCIKTRISVYESTIKSQEAIVLVEIVKTINDLSLPTIDRIEKSIRSIISRFNSILKPRFRYLIRPVYPVIK